MNRQRAAVERLTLSRNRLRLALAEGSTVGTAGALLGRLVQRHPLGAAALALLVGGLLSRLRPWRWALEPELWTVLLPPLAAALAGAPISGWADVLAALLRQRAATPAAAPPPAPAAAATAPDQASACPSKNA